MEKTRIAINGFGRIGRLVLKASIARSDLEICAINDLTEPKILAHLLKYDSTHGRFPEEVYAEEETLLVGGNKISILNESDPSKLPWKKLKVDVVVFRWPIPNNNCSLLTNADPPPFVFDFVESTLTSFC